MAQALLAGLVWVLLPAALAVAAAAQASVKASPYVLAVLQP